MDEHVEPSNRPTVTHEPNKSAGLSWQEAATAVVGDRLFRLTGSADLQCVPDLMRALERRLPGRGGCLQLDFGGVTGIDGVATAALVDLWRRARDRGFSIELLGVTRDVSAHLRLYRVPDAVAAREPGPGLFEHLGATGVSAAVAARDGLVLAADVTVGMVVGLARPRTLRWAAVVEQCNLIGSQALGIVGLIALLVGATLAFQSAYQLQKFGAAIYVATLTALSVVREMGPLITAILVAGRSGSAITSEVATMKVNEELDALQVMGIPLTDFVAIPRVLAMVTMLPLLVLMADLLGILGGWVVAVGSMDLSSAAYSHATLEALTLRDLATGLCKSVVFAWLIALIGLYHGMRVSGGAQEVGRATTASVVSAIFAVIVADSVFSILFYVVLP